LRTWELGERSAHVDAGGDQLSRRKARSQRRRHRHELEPGVIHSDSNVGNVPIDDNEAAVLIDFDSFSRGPREWDLIQTAIFADRFGRDLRLRRGPATKIWR
jgi:aminoglycoside phosphotransferase (APT) family kinase protein